MVVPQRAERNQGHEADHNAVSADDGEASAPRSWPGSSASPLGLDPYGQDDQQRLDHEGRGVRHTVGDQGGADQLDDAGADQRADDRRPPSRPAGVPPTATAAMASSSMPEPTRLASEDELIAMVTSPADAGREAADRVDANVSRA